MICHLCPRDCGALRTEHRGEGFCGMGTLPVVARIAPHFGEEPCISGTRGSGTVFFSGCTLRCLYCQNHEISLTGNGVTLTPRELAQGYKMLEESGVHNINLVTADHFVPAVLESFEIYRPNLPVVYNCSGYTSPKTLKLLDGVVDVYLPDFKYMYNKSALALSQADNYADVATAAIKEMIFQVGAPEFDENGLIKKGVIVRHLILPAHTRESIAVLEHLKRHFDNQVLVSLMCQYVPCGKACSDPKLSRKITRREYDNVKRVLFELGLDGFTQELSAASEEYIPSWTTEKKPNESDPFPPAGSDGPI